MTLEEVGKIAEVIETYQEVDIDRDTAVLMVELFSTALPESNGVLTVIMERPTSNTKDKR